MKQKWFLGVLASAIVVGGFGPAVHAETNSSSQKISESNQKVEEEVLEDAIEAANISKEEAIDIAKKAVKIPDDFIQERASFSSNWRGDLEVWRIEWRKRSRGYHNISVTVDAQSGNVVGIDQYQDFRDEEVSFPPKVDYDGAVDIAKKYIKELYPEKMDQIQLDERLKENSQSEPFRNRGSHEVRFYQLINGVPFEGNSIRFSITGNGDIRNFHYNWVNDVSFPTKVDILTQEEVEKQVGEQLEMELRYQYNRYFQGQRQEEAELVYVPTETGLNGYYGNFTGYIDANTGERVDYNGNVIDEISISEEPVAKESTPLKELTEELDQDAAYQIVEEVLTLPEGVELERSQYHENWRGDGTPVWSFNWRNTDQPYAPFFIRAEVNAKTGEILSFNNDKDRFVENKEVDITISKEKAKEIASEFLKKVAAHHAGELYVTTAGDHYFNNEEKPRYYNVSFVRKENGIFVNGLNINVTVSTETGEIVRYRNEWQDISFPNAENVISKEKAKEIYLSNTDIELAYFLPRSNEEGEKKANLVYRQQLKINESVYLDANTGQWKDYRTGEVYSHETEVTDLKDHWAKKEIETMIEYNILEAKDGKVNPDQAVTKAEFVDLVMKALGRHYYYGRDGESPFEDVSKDDKYYSALLQAYEMELISHDQEKFFPDNKATREFAAVLIVRALGYDKLASEPGVFLPDFSDVDAISHKGHIGLVQRLSIMNGYKGSFKPEQAMTTAEAAVTLLRFMEKKASLNERRY